VSGRWSDRSDRGSGRGQRRRNAPRDAPARQEPVKGARADASGAPAEARRAGAADRDFHLYDRKRADQARARAKLERASYDPAAPDPDDEWTIADDNGSGLARTPAPSPVGDALQQFLARRGWSERLSGSTASQRWDEVVGEDLASRCEPVRIAGGTLVIRAESQVWATQLRYLVPQLVANTNAVLGGHQVREVRLVVGPLEGHGEL
jgi:hypothetical protein